MDIQVLREFLDLSFTLSFSKSAERVFISQSSLSKHIAQLEEELGVQLFIRSRQNVCLTPIGLTLQEKFKKVVEDYNDAISIIRNNTEDLQGSLRIGYLDGAVRNLLSNTISTFSKKFPKMNVVLSALEVGDLSNALKIDKIDIALCIVFPNTQVPLNMFFKPLYSDTVAAVVAKNNPLASKESLMFEDLLAYPLILPSPIQYPSYASIIREHIEESPMTANIICDFSNIMTALIMVESEMGVSILPTNISNQNSQTTFIPIKNCRPNLQIGAMWKKNNSISGISEFIDEISMHAMEIYFQK